MSDHVACNDPECDCYLDEAPTCPECGCGLDEEHDFDCSEGDEEANDDEDLA